MEEHSLFIAQLLDPDEQALIKTADAASKTFARLEANPGRGGIGNPALQAAESIIDFKTAAEKGIRTSQIESIIHPRPRRPRPARSGTLQGRTRTRRLKARPCLSGLVGVACPCFHRRQGPRHGENRRSPCLNCWTRRRTKRATGSAACLSCRKPPRRPS